MRILIVATICWTFIAAALSSSVPVHRTNPAPNRPFDEYGNICWLDETARLDSFAIELQNDPTATGIIYFFDGNPPCHEEAIARAIRAKSYIVNHRGVAWNRVMWRYGGHRSDMVFVLIISPRGAAEYKFTSSLLLSRDEVKAEDCKAHVFRRPKCPKR